MICVYKILHLTLTHTRILKPLYVTQKAKTNLMALAIFNWRSVFNSYYYAAIFDQMVMKLGF